MLTTPVKRLTHWDLDLLANLFVILKGLKTHDLMLFVLWTSVTTAVIFYVNQKCIHFAFDTLQQFQTLKV